MMSDRNTISRRSQYATVPNAALRDQRLSLEARGFLALIMSMSEGWVFRRKNLMETAGIGRDKYQRIVKELEVSGYLRIVNVQADDGRFTGREWQIYDAPLETEETQDVDTEGLKTRSPVTGGLKNRRTVLPDGGETRPLKKTNLDKKTNSKAPHPPKRGAERRVSNSQFDAADRVRAMYRAEGYDV